MPDPARRSVAGAAVVSGIGLHTGTRARVTLQPAPPGHGIAFRRVDLEGQPRIPAALRQVVSTDHRTALGTSEARVETVEHVLSAAMALELDDLLIDVDGPEVPLTDGSARAYFDALAEAGITSLPGEAAELAIPAPLTVQEGMATYIVAPAPGLRLTTTIDWDHPVIGRQSGSYDITPARFAEDLADARTFGFRADADALQAKGLARGASDETAIILSAAAAGTKLRWPDEFVRHKTVDLLGDLALLGRRLKADIVAFRPSHAGNVALARAIERVSALSAPPVLGIQEILGTLPHRYPMLLVDRIVEVQGRERIVGIKNVTFNEPFFQGHFPDHPVMPGVLIIEAMAQVGGMLLMGAVDDPASKLVLFMSLDGVKFRRPVVPGDQIRFELEMMHFRGRNCRMRGAGYVDGELVAEAEMAARLVDR